MDSSIQKEGMKGIIQSLAHSNSGLPNVTSFCMEAHPPHPLEPLHMSSLSNRIAQTSL